MLKDSFMKASPIRCLVTAGPTREFFDPVRFMSNPSSGKMGYRLAAEALARGWRVELISGPVSLPEPPGALVTQAVTGEDMYAAVDKRFDDCDILIMTAAIMDYRPRRVAERKIKKHQLSMHLEMEPVIDVLATVARRKKGQVIVGFAAETDNLEAYALKKLKEKNADYIVANLIGGSQSAFGRDTNEVTLFSRSAAPLAYGPATKARVAAWILDQVTPALGSA